MSERAAKALREYWLARGYDVRVRIETIPAVLVGKGPVEILRTDLVNGLPPAMARRGHQLPVLGRRPA